MITQAQAARMLSEFENEVQRVGYEAADKRCLNSIFGYLKLRCSNAEIYSSTHKLKAVEALESRWHRDRIGKPILADHGDGIMGYDPAGTQRGALTIGSILRELRALLVELPEKIETPAPIILPPMLALGVSPAGTITADTVDATVAKAVEKALAARDAQRERANA